MDMVFLETLFDYIHIEFKYQGHLNSQLKSISYTLNLEELVLFHSITDKDYKIPKILTY